MKNDQKSIRSLMGVARKARLRARARYSRFRVGAALETAGGKVYSGCNIENASYGLSICAERVALLKALSEGAKKFRKLAVVTGADEPTSPCGACRQFLWEYCGDIPIHLGTLRGKLRTHQLGELFPHPFDQSSVARASTSSSNRNPGNPRSRRKLEK